MPRQRRRLGIGQRKELAYELFARGYSNREVARECAVTPDTAGRYRKQWQEGVKAEAAANPGLLRDVLKNTVESLESLSRVRAQAWMQYERSGVSDSVKATFLNTVLKAEHERANILGLMGVKSDTAALFARIRQQQEQLISFMRDHLCDDDRRLLENYVVEQFAEDLAAVQTMADL
jgi:hypothetical protein